MMRDIHRPTRRSIVVAEKGHAGLRLRRIAGMVTGRSLLLQ
jgi:hypothetical protein